VHGARLGLGAAAVAVPATVLQVGTAVVLSQLAVRAFGGWMGSRLGGAHVVPVLLGDGARLFDNLGDAEVQLEQVRAVEAPGVTHPKYRVVT